MPTYLCHGFRWYRKSIRVFIVLNNLEDAAADWVIAPKTSTAILEAIRDIYDFVPVYKAVAPPPRASAQSQIIPMHTDEDFELPHPRVAPSEDKVLCHDWSQVKLLEEFDVGEQRSPVRPYAFLADHAVRIDLHADVMLEMQKYEELLRQRPRPWFEQLRSEMQPEEQIKWYVVSCGDDERPV